jgi:hypothetical protein
MNKINNLLCVILLGINLFCFSLDNDATDDYSLLIEDYKQFDEWQNKIDLLQKKIDALEKEGEELHFYFDTSGKITGTAVMCGIIAACIDPTHTINTFILAVSTLGGMTTSALLGHEQKHLEINTAKINGLKNKQQEIIAEYNHCRLGA